MPSEIKNQKSKISTTNGRATLCVVAISKNEERDLPGFLDNLLPWVDEVVLVDDGSTDRTGEIAEAAGEKVKFCEHARDAHQGFAGQRNYGIEQTSSEWVLNMDIDERVSPELRDEILMTIQETVLNAYRYRRLNYFLHRPVRHGGWDSWNHPQLARRGRHHYAGKLHEQAIVDGAPDSIGQLKGLMWHFNDEGYRERMRKSFQYCELEAGRLLESKQLITQSRLMLAPIKEFIKKYVLKKGYRDGTPGLIAAMHAACATFRALALAWDEQNKIPREELEADLKGSESVNP